MTTKYTPGPWDLDGLTVYKLNNDPPHKQANLFTTRVDAGYSQWNGRTSFEECQANARLIAAAPELLELLAAVVENRSECFIPQDKDGLYRWDEKVRAAIAKATGEQQ